MIGGGDDGDGVKPGIGGRLGINGAGPAGGEPGRGGKLGINGAGGGSSGLGISGGG